MKRVLLNLREEDVRIADREAARLGVSRSEVVRRALGRLAPADVAEETLEARQRRVRAFLSAMRELGRRMADDPDWDPVAIIRADREGYRHRP